MSTNKYCIYCVCFGIASGACRSKLIEPDIKWPTPITRSVLATCKLNSLKATSETVARNIFYRKRKTLCS